MGSALLEEQTSAADPILPSEAFPDATPFQTKPVSYARDTGEGGAEYDQKTRPDAISAGGSTPEGPRPRLGARSASSPMRAVRSPWRSDRPALLSPRSLPPSSAWTRIALITTCRRSLRGVIAKVAIVSRLCRRPQSDSHSTSKVLPFQRATAPEASSVPNASVSPRVVTVVRLHGLFSPRPFAHAVTARPGFCDAR